MRFEELTAQTLLALAIHAEEEDAKIYLNFAAHLKTDYPASAQIFEGVAKEEIAHRTKLYTLYKEKFGTFLPLIRRQDVKGFMLRKPIWLQKTLSLEAIRDEAANMEHEAANFYRKAAAQSQDIDLRQLLIELAETEEGHALTAQNLRETHLGESAQEEEAKRAHQKFVLTYVQPGLAGLMDGSVSTLAPLFAAAFATQSTHETFIVGLAASVGAGISMGLTEALSDDGEISGRGSPHIRGWVTGIMTLLGGLGHTVPYLFSNFTFATTLAIIVVVVELLAIAWIRWKYMETSFMKATLQIVVGGALVVAVGMLLGRL
jgi:erythrin-vacuolar iron transport family protein